MLSARCYTRRVTSVSLTGLELKTGASLLILQFTKKYSCILHPCITYYYVKESLKRIFLREKNQNKAKLKKGTTPSNRKLMDIT